MGALDRSIGFPRDRSATDPRVILTPGLAESLVADGYRLVSEPGIGEGVGIADRELRLAGVNLLPAAAAWECPLLLRYKAFRPEELRRLEPGQAAGAVFHAEGNPALIEALIESGVRAWSYEFLEEDGRYPLMSAGGRISGIQAVLLGCRHLQAPSGGRGILLGGVPGASPAKVLVIGHGNVGAAAADTAHALGADVTVLSRTDEGRHRYLTRAPAGVRALVNNPETLRAELADADLVIGAILISTYDTPPMIEEDDLDLMKPGAVIVDATCGYGPGYLPTAGPVQPAEAPPRRVRGVLHVKVDVLPSLVPTTASRAYAAAATPYLRRLARVALSGAEDAAIDTALIAAHGEIVHPVVSEHAAHYALAG
jgi:alanine dehydrogenase